MIPLMKTWTGKSGGGLYMKPPNILQSLSASNSRSYKFTKLTTWVTVFCPHLYSRDITCSETYLVKRQMHKIELDCQTSSRTASWISHANVQGTCNLRRFLAHAFHNTTGFSGSSFCWIIITKRIWSKIFMKGRQLDSFCQPFQVPCRSDIIVLTKMPDNGKSKWNTRKQPQWKKTSMNPLDVSVLLH